MKIEPEITSKVLFDRGRPPSCSWERFGLDFGFFWVASAAPGRPLGLPGAPWAGLGAPWAVSGPSLGAPKLEQTWKKTPRNFKMAFLGLPGSPGVRSWWISGRFLGESDGFLFDFWSILVPKSVAKPLRRKALRGLLFAGVFADGSVSFSSFSVELAFGWPSRKVVFY